MLGLRSKIAQKILGYLFLHQGESLYVNEMCRRFGVDRDGSGEEGRDEGELRLPKRQRWNGPGDKSIDNQV